MRSAQLIICRACSPRPLPLPNHMSPSLPLGAKETLPKRILVMHDKGRYHA